MMTDITAWILSSSALILVVAALRCLLRGSVADNAGGEASFKCRFCEKYLFEGLAFRKKGARAMAASRRGLPAVRVERCHRSE